MTVEQTMRRIPPHQCCSNVLSEDIRFQTFILQMQLMTKYFLLTLYKLKALYLQLTSFIKTVFPKKHQPLLPNPKSIHSIKKTTLILDLYFQMCVEIFVINQLYSIHITIYTQESQNIHVKTLLNLQNSSTKSHDISVLLIKIHLKYKQVANKPQTMLGTHKMCCSGVSGQVFNQRLTFYFI